MNHAKSAFKCLVGLLIFCYLLWSKQNIENNGGLASKQTCTPTEEW